MTIDIARGRPGLRNLFDGFDEDIKAYFWEFRALVESDFSLQVILAYSFFRLEQGQRTALFCGARKLLKTDSDLTWKAIDGHHMSRAKTFKDSSKISLALQFRPTSRTL